MGYMRHHAIVVSALTEDRIRLAHDTAKSLGCAVSSVVGPVMNGYYSFMVAPDGSKEGWDESDAGDAQRDAFIAWLRATHDGNWWGWVEVQFDDDKGETKATRHSDQDPEEDSNA